MQISLKRRVFRPIFLIKFDKIRIREAISKNFIVQLAI